MELADKVQRFLIGDPVCGGFSPEEWQQIIAALRQADLAQTEIKGHMRIEDELKVDLFAAQDRVAELEKLLGEALENLIWCGGSADFGYGGKAQVGYDKGPRTTIAAIHEVLKSRP